MSDIDVLERVRGTNRYPADRDLPPETQDAAVAISRIERRMGMSTDQLVRETREQPPRRPRLLAAAIVVAALIGVLALYATGVIGGDATPDVADEVPVTPVDGAVTTANELPADLLERAMAGDPTALGQSMFWAWWTNDQELLATLGDIHPADEFEGIKQRAAVIDRFSGDQEWELGECELLLGTSNNYTCSVTGLGSHPVFGYEPGHSATYQMFVANDRIGGFFPDEFGFNHREDLTFDAVFREVREADPQAFNRACRPVFMDGQRIDDMQFDLDCADLAAEYFGLDG